jgi:hypothetical protein
VNNNRLVIAIVVLAVLAGALASQLRSHQSSTSLEKPKVTLPELKRDEITKVEIDNPEKKLKVTLQKQDKTWRLSAPLDALADSAAAEAVLDKLTDLKVAGDVSTRKESHAKLKVDAAQGLHVKAFAGDKSLLDVYLGDTKSTGTMLRKEGEDTVVAARGSIRYAFDKELKYLRDRTITDADAASFKAMALVSPKGSFKFEKPEGGKWTQAKGEKPIKDFAESKVEGLVLAFAKLRASDFADASATPEATGLAAPQATLVVTPKEGADLKVELGQLDPGQTDYFVRVSGNPVVYRISKYTGERLLADAAAFSEPPKKPGEASANAGGQGMPVAGGGDLPPEILKQLQQQGMMGGAHPH